MKNKTIKILFLLFGMLLPAFAYGYVGPGAGLTAIGTALALVGAVLLAIIGFIWYPVKRLLNARRGSSGK